MVILKENLENISKDIVILGNLYPRKNLYQYTIRFISHSIEIKFYHNNIKYQKIYKLRLDNIQGLPLPNQEQMNLIKISIKLYSI